MDATAFLEKVRKNKLIIKNKLIERDDWHDMSLRLTTYSDGDRVQTSRKSQNEPNASDMCIDAQKECENAVARLVAEQAEVLSVIEQLEPDEYDVLHMRYIQQLTNSEVAEIRGHGASWASTLHTKGLEKVQQILDGGQK